MAKQATAPAKVDDKKAREMLDHFNDIKSLHGEKIKDFELYEEAFLGKWAEGASMKQQRSSAKIVQSPDARNQVLGAMGLMLGTDPTFTIEQADEASTFDKDGLEESLQNWWIQAGRVKKRPIHYDMVLSAILYGEMHTAIDSMKDVCKRLEKSAGANDKRYKRARMIETKTPIIPQVWNPKHGYPEIDNFGLAAYGREVKTTIGSIKSTYGDLIPEDVANKGDNKSVTASYLYTLDTFAMWVEGKPIITEPMIYSEIPIDVTLTGIGGSQLFEKQEDQRQPLLYTLMKNGLYDAQNIMMTVLFTTMFTLGLSAQLIHTAPEDHPEKKLDMNFDDIIGVFELVQGESVAPMDMSKLINPILIQAMQIAEQKGEESTIYKQAFGAAIGRNTTFSEMSLLGQAGRLPMIGTQRMGGEGISHLVELALMVIRESAYDYRGYNVKFDPKVIPQSLLINTKLDVKLPQDNLQLANIAHLLKGDGLADDEWIQTNIMNMQNSKGMKRKIWRDQAEQAMFGVWLKGLLERQAAQAQPPSINSQTPPATPPPPGEGEGNMTAQPAPGGAGMQAGLPSAQAGMLPGVGEGMAVSGEEGAI